MSWLFSRVLVEEYLQVISLDTTLYALSSEMSTVSMFLFNGKTTELYNHSRYGMTFARLMEGRGTELWTWFLEDSPVKRFLLLQEEEIFLQKTYGGEMFRVIREICPELVFAENVSEKAILQAEKDLEHIGYRCVYKKLSASELGAPHIRDRYWILAHSYDNGKLLRAINAETQGMQKLQNHIWNGDPTQSRVDDGLAFRLDRLKATGNGQVPVVAATAFTQLMRNLLDEKETT